ncbi:MAG: amidohydrolase family protein [Oscillospiraceae bacterium]
MIIDFHTHAFPDKIYTKAMKSLSACCGNVKPFHSGSITSLTNYLDKNNVDKAVVLNIATNPKQEHSVNDFAISLLENEKLIPFGSIHPESENIDAELKRLKTAGIKGIKLHPDYQNFFVDEKRMLPIYQKIAEMGFITVFHAGVDIGFPSPVHCTPKSLASILPYFEDAPVIAAHFGGYLLWQETLKYLAGTNIYLDTAFSYSKMPPQYANEIIENHNSEKIIFGSDMPWSGTCDEIDFLNSLKLTNNQKENILSNNAKRILNI